MSEKLLLRVEEAAERLSLGRSKTYELIASQQLRVVRIGRAVRVPASSLEDFIHRCQQESCDMR